MVKAFKIFGVGLTVTDDEDGDEVEANNSDEEPDVLTDFEKDFTSIYLPNHQRFIFISLIYNSLIRVVVKKLLVQKFSKLTIYLFI